MGGATLKRVDEIGYYSGPKSIPGIKFRHAATDLGVTAWGMNVIEIEPGVEEYPEHDHAKDGQEEVYVVLRGAGTLRTDGTDASIDSGTLIRVDPGTRRKFVAGPGGLTLLAIGGTPGKAYAPRR